MRGLIFTYVAAYGGTLLALVRPFEGFLIYVCFSILKPDALWAYSVPPGNYSRLLFGGVFIGWALRGFGNWRSGRAFAPVCALALYLAWTAVSAFSAQDQVLAWSGAESTFKIVVPTLIGLTLIKSREQLRQLAWVIVASQGFLALEFNASYYGGFNRLVTVGFAGMEEKSVAITMIVGAAVGLFLGFEARRTTVKALAFSLTALMIHVPLFTFSRGGILALGVAGALAMWLIPKRPKYVVVLTGAILLGVRLAGPEVRAFFATSFAEEGDRDRSSQDRLELWGQAWETMRDHSLVGVGPRNWGKWAASEYGWGREKEVHNTWLQTGAELGFPGLLALTAFFALTIVRLLPLARARLEGHDSVGDNFARLAVCGIGAFVVASQFITAYGIEVPYHVALLGLSVLKLKSTSLAENAAVAPLPARSALSVSSASAARIRPDSEAPGTHPTPVEAGSSRR